MTDIVAIGEPMIEFNQTEQGQPQYLQGYGGDTSNFAIAAARQGARAGYIARIGDDSFGRMLLDLWRREQVDVSGVGVDANGFTGAYFVTHEATGHQFSFMRSGSAASKMTPRDLPLPIIEGARFLHVSGISQAISPGACDAVFAAIAAARAAGVAVSYDSNLRLKLWPVARARAVICETIRLSDYFFPSLEDAQVLAQLGEPDAILDWCFAQGARAVLLKLGADGVLVAPASDAPRTRLAGHPVATIDATGAGDCFAGSLIARRTAGDDLLTAARYANAAAALATTDFGAVAPIPYPRQVYALLNEGSK